MLGISSYLCSRHIAKAFTRNQFTEGTEIDSPSVIIFGLKNLVCAGASRGGVHVHSPPLGPFDPRAENRPHSFANGAWDLSGFMRYLQHQGWITNTTNDDLPV